MMLKIFVLSAIQLLTTVSVQSYSFWRPWRPWPGRHLPPYIPPVRPVNPCQGTTILRGYSGVLSSPNYPQNYRPYSNCVWKIFSPPGTRFVIIHFQDFHLESSSTCSYDYVEIRNGKSPTSYLLKKLCGKTSPKIVTGPSAFIRFRSDLSLNYKGFRAVYQVGTNMQGTVGPYYCHWVENIARGKI